MARGLQISGFGVAPSTGYTSTARVADPAFRLLRGPLHSTPFSRQMMAARLGVRRAPAPVRSPAFTSVCGPLMPCQSQPRARRALSGLGAIMVGCAPFQLAIDRLKATLAAADKAGVSEAAPAYVAAAAFLDKYDGFLNVTVVYDDNACTTATQEAERHLNNVGALIDAISGPGASQQTTGPTAPNDPTPLSQKPGDQGSLDMILSVAKWGGIAVATLAVAYMVGPAVRELSTTLAQKFAHR